MCTRTACALCAIMNKFSKNEFAKPYHLLYISLRLTIFQEHAINVCLIKKNYCAFNLNVMIMSFVFLRLLLKKSSHSLLFPFWWYMMMMFSSFNDTVFSIFLSFKWNKFVVHHTYRTQIPLSFMFILFFIVGRSALYHFFIWWSLLVISLFLLQK